MCVQAPKLLPFSWFQHAIIDNTSEFPTPRGTITVVDRALKSNYEEVTFDQKINRPII